MFPQKWWTSYEWQQGVDSWFFYNRNRLGITAIAHSIVRCFDNMIFKSGTAFGKETIG